MSRPTSATSKPKRIDPPSAGAYYLIQTPEAPSQNRLGQLHVCEIIRVFKAITESERGEETLTVESHPTGRVHSRWQNSVLRHR
jgi:hypothetical protein